MSLIHFLDEFSSVSQRALAVPPSPIVEETVCAFPDGQSEGPGGPAVAASPIVEQILSVFPDGLSEGPGGPAAANSRTSCVAILDRSRLESSSGQGEGEGGGSKEGGSEEVRKERPSKTKI